MENYNMDIWCNDDVFKNTSGCKQYISINELLLPNYKDERIAHCVWREKDSGKECSHRGLRMIQKLNSKIKMESNGKIKNVKVEAGE